MKLQRTILALAVAATFGPVMAQSTGSHQEARQITTVLKAGNVVGNVTLTWGRGITGKGAIIGIIDQGFDVTHKDFAGSILAARNFNPTIGGTTVTWGLHGTQMAGIAAANLDQILKYDPLTGKLLTPTAGLGTVGLAPDAMLLLAQVGEGGTTGMINGDAVRLALDWTSAKGAHVINMSFGSNYDKTFQGATKLLGTSGTWVAPSNYGSMYGNTKADMAQYAVATNRGSVLVAAAGNQGLPYAAFPGAFATQVDSTGKLVLGGRMLIVGATDPTGTVMPSFSNRAGHICTNVVGTQCNDPFRVRDFYVVAPGMQVYGSLPNQPIANIKQVADSAFPVSGTSPAAAYVSGGIGLMKQAWPQLRGEQLVAITLNTAKDLGAKGVDDVYGHGMVDFDAATRPMGTLVFATNTKLTGTGIVGKTTTLSSTGIVTTGAIGLGASSVLKGTQVVDGMGRNYAVDLTKAMGYNNSMSYQFGTPWMSLAGTNYKHLSNNIGKDATLTMMSSDNGIATQYAWTVSEGTRASFEVGSLHEQNGFLGTKGAGAMAFGSSSTQWAGFGFQHNIVGNTNLIGNYTLGITRAGNAAESMIQVGSSVIADAWKLGVSQDKVFFQGKTRDTISLAIAGPVAVRRGFATVTGVTGYTYTDNADGTTDANPVTQSERVSIAPQVREMNLVLGYNVAVKQETSIGVNLVRQFNAGGNAGVMANGVSLMVRHLF